jgi:hypothetical protein
MIFSFVVFRQALNFAQRFCHDIFLFSLMDMGVAMRRTRLWWPA